MFYLLGNVNVEFLKEITTPDFINSIWVNLLEGHQS